MHFQETQAQIVYRDVLLYLWVFGDAVKLSVTILTMFICMERFLAIWAPNLFNRINKAKIVWALIAASTIIGLLHLSPAFTGYPSLKPNEQEVYIKKLNFYGESGVNEFVFKLIYGIKIASCIAIFILCLFVATGMIIKSKKAENMTTTGKEKWKSTRRLCVLQMVIAIPTLIDHITWVTNKIIIDNHNVYTFGIEALLHLDYNRAMYEIEYKSLFIYTWMVQTALGAIDHCCRFLFYFAFMKNFRDAFLGLRNKNRITSITVNSNKI